MQYSLLFVSLVFLVPLCCWGDPSPLTRRGTLRVVICVVYCTAMSTQLSMGSDTGRTRSTLCVSSVSGPSHAAHVRWGAGGNIMRNIATSRVRRPIAALLSFENTSRHWLGVSLSHAEPNVAVCSSGPATTDSSGAAKTDSAPEPDDSDVLVSGVLV